MRHHTQLWAVTLAIVAVVLGAGFVRQALSAVEPSTEALVERAVEHIAGDPALDLRATQRLVRQAAVAVDLGSDRTAAGSFVLATQYVQERNFAMAENAFREAIALDPEWAAAYAGLGNMLRAYLVGREAEAETLLREALRFEPDRSRTHNDLAVVLRRMERFDEAKAAALQALELAPDDVAAHNNYAVLLIKIGDVDGAIEHFQSAADLAPNHPKPWYNLACAYVKKAAYDNPANTGIPWEDLGPDDLAMDRVEDALVALERAFALSESMRNEALGDEDLAPIQDLERFQRLLLRKA